MPNRHPNSRAYLDVRLDVEAVADEHIFGAAQKDVVDVDVGDGVNAMCYQQNPPLGQYLF